MFPFTRKDKPRMMAAPHTVPGDPRRHARDGNTSPLPARHTPQTHTIAISEDMREWMLGEADRLDLSAADNDTRIRDLIDQTREWRARADELRQLAAFPAPAHPGPAHYPAYDEGPHAPADPDEYQRTWPPMQWRPSPAIVEAAAEGAPPALFGLRPQSEARATGWIDAGSGPGYAPQDWQTEHIPTVNGDPR